jgi:hypothetical protein
LFELLGWLLSLMYQTESIFAALERDFGHCQELSVSTAMQDGCRDTRAGRDLGLLFATGPLTGWIHKIMSVVFGFFRSSCRTAEFHKAKFFKGLSPVVGAGGGNTT